MTHVSLFTGIGGLDLAAEWAGFESVLQVEMGEYATKILEKHWPNVPRIKDVREVNSESVDRPITVISGGFPCQPFSQAGKRRGTGDDRYLWPEMLRIIREIEPAWVVGENVSGLLSLNEGLEFETIATDLEEAGYEVLPLHYSAAGVGAPHRRDRVFIVANAKLSTSTADSDRREKCFINYRPEVRTLNSTSSKAVADADKQRMEGSEKSGGFKESGKEQNKQSVRCRESIDQWETEPDVGRVANGISNRVDRIRALGNAVVPQQAYPIFKAIAKVEQAVTGEGYMP